MNKKVIGWGIAGLVALGVVAVVCGQSTGTASAHDPIYEHDHPHVEVDHAPLSLEDTLKKAFVDKGYTHFEVRCDSFDGYLGAHADGLLTAESQARLHGGEWSFEQDMSEASISVKAGAEAVVCAGSGVKHSVFGTGFNK